MKNRQALVALATAGAIWGLTVPLSKLALDTAGPAWLTVIRFALAAPLLALAGRRHLRAALTPSVLATGALGFGAVILLQNAGIEQTSVSHAAVIVGTVPVLVALIAAATSRTRATRQAWLGYLVALLGVTLVAGAAARNATTTGDLLVLASAALSAVFIALQPRLLARRDPAAVTAVQFAAGALVSLPVALIAQGAPPPIHDATAILPVLALALPGTLLPFWLFAYGQARAGAELASRRGRDHRRHPPQQRPAPRQAPPPQTRAQLASSRG